MKKTLSRNNGANQTDTILVTTVGTAPSVLTSTIWALAHQENIVPNQIRVLTTRLGRQRLEQAVFSPQVELGGITVWDALRADLQNRGFNLAGRLQFNPSTNYLRVFTGLSREGVPLELDDITSEVENEQVADAMLETLRGVMADDSHIIASIAGGRKTVSALFYACMSLIGRANDRIIHVTVNEPFEKASLKPAFYFPTQRLQELDAGGKQRVLARDAKVNIINVPFVPLRHLFPKEMGQTPRKFSALVTGYRQAGANNLNGLIKLKVYRSRPLMEVNGVALELGPREQLLMLFFADRLKEGRPHHGDVGKHLEEDVDSFRAALIREAEPNNMADWRGKEGLQKRLESDDLRKALSNLRGKIEKAGPPVSLLIPALPRKKRYGLSIDQKSVAIL